MNTTIELLSNEFNQEVFDKIKSFLDNTSNSKVSISINNNHRNFPPKETREEYFARLDKAIKNVEEGNFVSFSWEAFKAHTEELLNKS